MSDYDDTNRGALFRNERKEAETHADYNGTLNVNGQEFWINSWLKESKGGKKYMSLSIKPKDASASAPAQKSTVSLEDMPF